ncbi:hypothetical protein GYMLUDRAFT_199436 [Collybiopsis luxurians FD-317 M1]|uniref:Uncharacterized protein n=1 Tax=Collybiopsis luxurians FD-317 M1 TaxID=944289 RepID=A0A0D0CZ46_9AGAR|nr:hypothetical protein GYMLUDRAFT_199436 [Collybiopsis luxurians FD-317 M1]
MLFPVPLHFFLAFLLASSALTSATPLKDSNGYRLARGLPPMPPRNFGRSKPGREPTPVLRARASPSPSPSGVVQYSGRLEVRSDNGSTIGYVQDKTGLPVAQGADLEISIMASSTRKEHLDVVAIGSTALPSSSIYVGASSKESAEATIGANSSSTLLFTNVQRTAPMSRPVMTSNRNASVESAIWKIDSNTKELTAQYVNPDGSLPTTFLVYNIEGQNLFFTGDVNSGNSSYEQAVSILRAITYFQLTGFLSQKLFIVN